MIVRYFRRYVVLGTLTLVAAFAATSSSSPAQMRQQIANDIASKAGTQFVQKIQGETCSQFASTMAQMKSKSSGSSSGSSSMSSKLKANPQARTTFVNIVAAPLLNKLIDCDMLPGGM